MNDIQRAFLKGKISAANAACLDSVTCARAHGNALAAQRIQEAIYNLNSAERILLDQDDNHAR